MSKTDILFVNTRTRFQRLHDLKFFYGWVVNFEGETLTIRTSSESNLQSGQIFVFELISLKGSRTVAGRLQEASDLKSIRSGVDGTAEANEICLRFTPIRHIRSTEESKACRKSAQLLVGSVRRSSGELDVAICDVSPSGAGLIVSKALKVGEQVELVVTSEDRELLLTGQVRHCKEERGSKMFRAGICFGDLNRIDSAVWSKFIEAA